MIAVWHVDSSSPFHLCCLEVKDDDVTDLLDRIAKDDLPLPENGEFLFIEGDKVVNQLNVLTGD